MHATLSLLCMLRFLMLQFLILNLCLLRRTPSNSNSFSAAAHAWATVSRNFSALAVAVVSASAAAWTTSCHPYRPCSHSHSHSHLPSSQRAQEKARARDPGMWHLPSCRRVGVETQEQRRSRIPRIVGGGGGGGGCCAMRRPSSCPCCRCCGRREGGGDDDDDDDRHRHCRRRSRRRDKCSRLGSYAGSGSCDERDDTGGTSTGDSSSLRAAADDHGTSHQGSSNSSRSGIEDCQDDDDAAEGKPEPTASRAKERGTEAAEDDPGNSSGSRRVRDGTGAAAIPTPAPGRVLPPSHPLLAVVTEPTSCDTEPQLVAALASLSRAVATDPGPGRVDLVIVRLEAPALLPSSSSSSSSQRKDAAAAAAAPPPEDDDDRFDAYRRRVRRLLRTLVRWSSTSGRTTGPAGDAEEDDGGSSSIVSNGLPPPRMKKKFLVVVSSGLLLAEPPLLRDVEDALAMPDGVHVKESHRDQLTAILERIKAGPDRPKKVVVGMSCHSVMSAVEAYTRYRPDYLLAGTCYPTLSHPEKQGDDVEGPELPGRIRNELERRTLGSSTSNELGRSDDDAAGIITEHPLHGNSPRRPLVLGIGGIDAANCGRVVRGGADGVAVIRSVLASPDPAEAVQRIADEMDRACCCGGGGDDDAASCPG